MQELKIRKKKKKKSISSISVATSYEVSLNTMQVRSPPKANPNLLLYYSPRKFCIDAVSVEHEFIMVLCNKPHVVSQ